MTNPLTTLNEPMVVEQMAGEKIVGEQMVKLLAARLIALRVAQTGFTLLELVVAIAIFSIISTASAYFIRNVLTAQERSTGISVQVEGLQKALALMQMDIEQLATRPIRDAFGDEQPALIGSETQLEFTRVGWPLLPMAQAPRSEVLRVKYAFEDQHWLRGYWPLPDQAEQAQPQVAVLLPDVKRVAIRYLFSVQGAPNQWSEVWPPQTPPERPLPQAIEVTLELARYGEIKRLFEVLNNSPTGLSASPSPGGARAIP